jgi:TATA-binding protein-associated factor
VLAATTIEEYAVLAAPAGEGDADELFESAHGLNSPLPQALATYLLLSVLNSPGPVCYREVAPNLRRLSSECVSLINSFVTDAKIDRATIPHIPTEVDLSGSKLNYFTVSIAEEVSGPIYKDLFGKCWKLKKKDISSFEAKHTTILASIATYKASQERHEVRALAAVASAIVALQAVPTKVGAVIKNLMNGVKVCTS